MLEKWNIFSEYEPNIDINILSKLFYSILTQLRTGHIKLNSCLHQLQHMKYYKNNRNTKYLKCDNICCEENNSGICKYCQNKPETVYHFVMECKQYETQRNILYIKTMRVLTKYILDFSLKNILFPPKNINNQHRKHILDSVCQFALNTRRLTFYF